MEKDRYQALIDIKNDVGEVCFMMAVTHLMDIGYNNMTEEYLSNAVTTIEAKDDKDAVMTNKFQIAIIKTAYKISHTITPLVLIKYAQQFINIKL